MAGWPFDLFGMGGQEEEEAEELRVLNVPRPIGRISRSWGHELRAKALVALLLDDRQQAICAVEGVDDSFMRDSMTWCLTADDMEVCYAALGLGELAAAAGETSTSVPRAFLLGAPKAFSALLGYVQHEMLVAPSTGVSDRFGFSSGAAGFERWSDRAFNHGGSRYLEFDGFTPHQGHPSYQEWIKRGPLAILQALVKSTACVTTLQACSELPGTLQRLRIWRKGFVQSPSVAAAARTVLEKLAPASSGYEVSPCLCPYCSKTLSEGQDALVVCERGTCMLQYCSVACKEEHWGVAHQYVCSAATSADATPGAKEREQCYHCGVAGVKLLLCKGCRNVLYCSKECQRMSWRSHKKACGKAGSSFSVSDIKVGACTFQCSRCLEWYQPGSLCRVPHPVHLQQEQGRMFGLSGQTFTDTHCSACHQTYSVMTEHPFDLMTGKPIPLPEGAPAPATKIQGPPWCYVGHHMTGALAASDKRRRFENAIVLVTSARLQEEIDQLDQTTRILTIIKGDGCSADASINFNFGVVGMRASETSPTVKLERHLPALEELSLIDVNFERIVLNAELTPALRALKLQNVPNQCHLTVELPLLKTVSIHFLGDCDEVIDTMLQHATGLEVFESYKLWVEEIHFASNELLSVDLHRSDSLKKLGLFAPNLRQLNLQGCYQLGSIDFEKQKPEVLHLLPPDHAPPTLNVNTANSCLGKHARKALREHPKVIECTSGGRETDAIMLRTRLEMLGR